VLFRSESTASLVEVERESRRPSALATIGAFEEGARRVLVAAENPIDPRTKRLRHLVARQRLGASDGGEEKHRARREP